MDPDPTHDLIRRLPPLTARPLIAKQPSNVTDLVAIARAAHEGGNDALTLINTLTGMATAVQQ